MGKILVTGGAGYIGLATVQALLNEGKEVLVYDSLCNGSFDTIDERVVCIQGDIRDRAALKSAFSDDVSSVVHLAALKSVDEGEKNPNEYYEVNVEGTKNLLSVMSEYRIPHMVFSSSAAVYGKGGHTAYTEHMPLAPYSVYGSTKVAAENLINDCIQQKKLQTATIFRYFNVAGSSVGHASNTAIGLLPLVAEALRDQKEFYIFGNDYQTKDGTCVRDFAHVEDIAQAHVHACVNPRNGVYNLGSGKALSVQEVVEAFEHVSGERVNVAYRPRRSGDVPFSCADIQKAKKELNWEPKKSFTDIVESVLEIHDN